MRFLLTFLLASLAAPGALRAQGPMSPSPAVRSSFRAVHYDVSAVLSPAMQSMTAHATVEFQASETSRVVLCELHPNLKITAVTDTAGKPVPFQRDPRYPLQVRADLSDPIAAGQ
ncbi:MAG: hypothetical protein ACRD5L_13195, partial [Bryobacteraceae bacterium]